MYRYIIQNLETGHVFTCLAAEARMWAYLNAQANDCAYNIFRVGGSMTPLFGSEIL